MSTIDSFRAAMLANGLDYAGPIYADGKLHRFKATGDHHCNSWYVLHDNACPAGAFGCWKRDIKEHWCDRTRNWSSDEERELHRRWEQMERERQRIEAEDKAKAQDLAGQILNRVKPVTTHPYTEYKGVKLFGIAGEDQGKLVLPLRDANGTLQSLQFISAAGEKRFLPHGQVAGCFFAISDEANGPLVICEGYATGASIFEAVGSATVCAMDCGNLEAVAKAMRAKWPERDIIIAADNDTWTEGNPGLQQAKHAATAIKAKLAVPHFKEVTTKPTDFNDLHQLDGLASVKAQISAATEVIETDDERYERLAKLTPAEYDRVREDEAKQAKIRVSTLDTEVDQRRPTRDASPADQGAELTFPNVEPYGSPVNGAALLEEIATTLSRFVVAPAEAIIAASLFVVYTYAFDLVDISPILFITGPTKRCGKSRFLAVLSRLVSRPFPTSSATAAAIYRTIELYHPTLNIDEVDAFVAGDEQLRGLINSGHTRDAAFHLGCVSVGDGDFQPRRWSTWTPKIFAGIGRLADTIEDRAIIIQMVRRHKDEPCEHLRHGMRFDDLPRKALRFVNDHKEAIISGNPPLPEALNDRAADNWTPLLILADIAGGDWPEKARRAAVALSGGDDSGTLGLSVQLLADIRDVFEAAGVDKLSSKDLAQRLALLEGRPWAEFGPQHRPISTNQVANLLRGFCVSPRTIRIGSATAKGYDLGDFADVFLRYLKENGPVKGNKVTLPVSMEESHRCEKVTPEVCDVSQSGLPGRKDRGCDVVTVPNSAADELVL